MPRLMRRSRVSWPSERYEPVESPLSEEYVRRHRGLVGDALDRPDVIDLFARGRRLPKGYGVGFDERVVEFPWLLASGPTGNTLDAGSTLNHDHVLDRFLPRLESLSIVTFAPEPVSFPERGISYLYADLRELPFEDGRFDTIISVSTLEHVGMDNELFGARIERSDDPAREVRGAVAELRRVLAPGGRVLVTVPYGEPGDQGWFRQFDRAAVERLVGWFEPRESAVTVFAYSKRGWQLSDLDSASGARYRDYRQDPRPVDDMAVAARAVACIDMRC